MDDVWICELVHPAFTSWEWLCRACALARRAELQRGMPVWLKVIPKRLIDGDCADCSRRAHAADHDGSAHLRAQRAHCWEPERAVRVVEKKAGVSRGRRGPATA